MERLRLLDRAILFSERAHRGQVRKGTSLPYFSHPVAVAMIVLEHGYGIEAAVVALLHDVIEDTPVDRDDVDEAFGQEIATAVMDLSEPDKRLPWEQRKTAYVARIAKGASELALPACAADKVHNLRSILWDLDRVRREGGDPQDVWRRFKREPKTMAAYHVAVANALSARGFRGPLHDALERAIATFAETVGADPRNPRFAP